MQEKFRSQNYPMINYLIEMKDETIRKDPATQRYDGAWKDKEAPSNLISSVLNGLCIPELFLAEEIINGMAQNWIADGLQRSTIFSQFRFGNMKLKKTVVNNIVDYVAKKVNSNGEVERDSKGNIIWENKTFDIANKSFDDLPRELQDTFDKYIIRTVIFEDCNKTKIAEIIRRYNNHTAMNNTQAAFTYIDHLARRIKEVEVNEFFKDMYKPTDLKAGRLSGVIMDTLMLVFHAENWKTRVKDIAKFLNENSSEEEVEYINEMTLQLNNMFVDDEDPVRSLFTIKNTPIWLGIFDRFIKLGIETERFHEFLSKFLTEYLHVEVDGTAFSDIDNSYSKKKKLDLYKTKSNSKNKSFVVMKMNIITRLMYDHFGIKMPEDSDCDEVETMEMETVEIEKEAENTVVEQSDSEENGKDDETNETSVGKRYYDELKRVDLINVTSENIKIVGDELLELVKGNKLEDADYENEDLIETACLYASVFNDYSLEINNDSKLFDYKNMAALCYTSGLLMDREDAEDSFFIEWLEYYAEEHKTTELLGSSKLKHNEMIMSFDDLLKRQRVLEAGIAS